MARVYFWVILAVITLLTAGVLYKQAESIKNARIDANMARFELTQTNVKVDSLAKRMKELQEIQLLEAQHIDELEVRINLK